MTLSHTPLWTLDELTAQAAQALAVDYLGQASGRVRDMPDMRTIRYYTTRGLIDRPARMRGRTALYSQRHLLQLVAIKRLQAKGLSLAEIQPQVMGQTNAALQRLAQLPASRPQTEEATEEPRSRVFWRTSPMPVPDEEAVQKPHGRDALPLVGVSLDEGVTLLLEAARPLDEFDVEALRSAAASLLKIVKIRRLLDTERPSQGDAP